MTFAHVIAQVDDRHGNRSTSPLMKHPYKVYPGNLSPFILNVYLIEGKLFSRHTRPPARKYETDIAPLATPNLKLFFANIRQTRHLEDKCGHYCQRSEKLNFSLNHRIQFSALIMGNTPQRFQLHQYKGVPVFLILASSIKSSPFSTPQRVQALTNVTLRCLSIAYFCISKNIVPCVGSKAVYTLSSGCAYSFLV